MVLMTQRISRGVTRGGKSGWRALARGDAVRIGLNREKRTKAAAAAGERRAREQRQRDDPRERSDSGEEKEYEHTEGSWAQRLPTGDSTRVGIGQERGQGSVHRSQDDRARRLRDQARKTKEADARTPRYVR